MNQPTRTNLLLLKERLRAVVNCTVILKGRRQALIKEFLQITRPLMQSRDEISQAYAQGLNALHVSASREGRSGLASLSAANRSELTVDVVGRNLLGLKYRDVICHETVTRNFDERDYDILGTTPWLDEAIDQFEGIVEELLSLASFEGKFRILAEELVRLTRRIRVLEERVAPGLKADIHQLGQYLAERERETHYRLKRFKNLQTHKS